MEEHIHARFIPESGVYIDSVNEDGQYMDCGVHPTVYSILSHTYMIPSQYLIRPYGVEFKRELHPGDKVRLPGLGIIEVSQEP